MAEVNEKGTHTCCDDTAKHQEMANAGVKDLHLNRPVKERPMPPLVGEPNRKGQGGL